MSTAAAAGAGIAKGAKAVWTFLRGIPWQVWVLAALALWVYRYGEARFDAGVEAERTRWETAQAAADAKAADAERKRDARAADINTASGQRASAQVADTRATTATAAERVRHEVLRVPVPADCPAELPAVVHDEGRAAVERARAAGRPLREGRNP